MDEKIYRVTLADGTILDNLSMNGNNFISEETIDATVFDGTCSPIIINDGTSDEIHEHMDLVQIMDVGGKSWFVLRDIPQKELEQVKLKSDIEYLAMMCDVEL